MSASAELRPETHWRELVLFVLAVAGGVYAFGDKLFAVGKATAGLEKIERIEATQSQQGIDIVRAKLQAEGANAAALRVETKVDNLNTYLMSLKLNGRR